MQLAIIPKPFDSLGKTNDMPLSQQSTGFVSDTSKVGTLIPNRIFVGGLPPNTSELELKAFFSTYGQVKDVKIINDRTGISRGLYGFVTFENPAEAEHVINNESESLIFKERKLNIGPAIRKQTLLSKPDVSNALYLTNPAIPYQLAIPSLQAQELILPQMASSLPQTVVLMPQPMLMPQSYAYMPSNNVAMPTNNWNDGVLSQPLHQTQTINNMSNSNNHNHAMPIPMSNNFMSPNSNHFLGGGATSVGMNVPQNWRWSSASQSLSYAPINPYEAPFSNSDMNPGLYQQSNQLHGIPNDLLTMSSFNNGLEQRIPHAAKRIRLTETFDGLLL